MLPEDPLFAGAGAGAGGGGVPGHGGNSVGNVLGSAVGNGGRLDGRTNGGGGGCGCASPASTVRGSAGCPDGPGCGFPSPGGGRPVGASVGMAGPVDVGAAVATFGGVGTAAPASGDSPPHVVAGRAGSDPGDHVPVAMRTITMPTPRRSGSAIIAAMRPAPAPPRRCATFCGGGIATPG